MSEHSVLRCDDCGLEVRESGYACVELPEGWQRVDADDFCPACVAALAATAEAGGEE